MSRGSYLFARGHQVINLVKACVRFTQGRPWWSRVKPGRPPEAALRTEVYTGSCLRDVSIIRSGVQVSNGIFTGPRRCAHTAAGQRGSVSMPGQRVPRWPGIDTEPRRWPVTPRPEPFVQRGLLPARWIDTSLRTAPRHLFIGGLSVESVLLIHDKTFDVDTPLFPSLSDNTDSSFPP